MDRWPLGVGVFSLVLLAFLPSAEIDEVIDFNRRRQGDSDYFSGVAFRQTLERIRADGYAYRERISTRNLAGVAVPVFDARQRPVASLCLVGMPHRYGGAQLTRLVARLKQEATHLQALVGSHRHAPQREAAWREWLHAAAAAD